MNAAMPGRCASRWVRTVAVVGSVAAAVITGGGTANAGTGRPSQQVECAGRVLTVSVAPGNDGNNWGAAEVDGGGHLVLASLEYSVRDDTTGVLLDDEVLTHGSAHANQNPIACAVATVQSRLGDIAPAGFVYPPGTGPDDIVTSSLHATVVPRP